MKTPYVYFFTLYHLAKSESTLKKENRHIYFIKKYAQNNQKHLKNSKFCVLYYFNKENHMKINAAYLSNAPGVIKDESQPLIVTRCGYFDVDDGEIVKTLRPKGRKDYQILYIAEGQAHFHFKGVKKIVNKGEMVLYRPYEPQYYFYYPKDKCQVFWVHFTGGDVENILGECGLNKGNLFFGGLFRISMAV